MKIEFLNPERTRARLTRRPFPWTRAYVAEVELRYDGHPWDGGKWADHDVLEHQESYKFVWYYTIGHAVERVEGDSRDGRFYGLQGEIHGERSRLVRGEERVRKKAYKREKRAREKQREREREGRAAVAWRPAEKFPEARLLRHGRPR